MLVGSKALGGMDRSNRQTYFHCLHWYIKMIQPLQPRNPLVTITEEQLAADVQAAPAALAIPWGDPEAVNAAIEALELQLAQALEQYMEPVPQMHHDDPMTGLGMDPEILSASEILAGLSLEAAPLDNGIPPLVLPPPAVQTGTGYMLPTASLPYVFP